VKRCGSGGELASEAAREGHLSPQCVGEVAQSAGEGNMIIAILACGRSPLALYD
jgi:hypothetical protein